MSAAIYAKTVAGLAAAIGIPSALWYKYANDERAAYYKDVNETALPESITTVRSMYVDSAMPGDLIFFKRNPLSCAHSPVAALGCLAQKGGDFDHVAVVIPPANGKYGSVQILEATPSEGLRVIELDERLKYSMSEKIAMLPLNVPGERRDAASSEIVSSSTAAGLAVQQTRDALANSLKDVARGYVRYSESVQYGSVHASLSLFGGLARMAPIPKDVKDTLYKGPHNPSCMFVLDSLYKSGVLARQQGVLRDGEGIEKILQQGDCGKFIPGNQDNGSGGLPVQTRSGYRYGELVMLKS